MTVTYPEAAAAATVLKQKHPYDTFEHLNSGKVREIFRTGTDDLVLVATDRVSAFDRVMGERIPNKGVVLNALSAFWFSQLDDVVSHHLWQPDYLPEGEFAKRVSLVEGLTPVPAECIVRGLITGSMWSAFKKAAAVDGKKEVLGFELPADMRESEMFPEPLFTPSTKAEVGHDENLTEEQTRELLAGWVDGLPEQQKQYWAGKDLFDELKRISLELFKRGRDYAAEKGIILADTKFEFGLKGNGEIVLMDEVFTPDSSRFVFKEDYVVGEKLVCRDKQILRDYLQKLVDAGEWDKEYPSPKLPDTLIAELEATYLLMYERLLGRPLELAA